MAGPLEDIIILDGFVIECESIEDNFEKAIVEYEFPYRDGALLEDMGMKPRSIRLRCFFLNENYETHKDFINHLKSRRDLSDLSHPKYGLVSGMVKNWVVRHNDCERAAEIDLTFTENLSGTIEPARYVDAESAVEEAFNNSLDEQESELRKDVATDLAAEAGGAAEAATILDAPLDETIPVADQVKKVTPAAREYMKELDRVFRTLDGLQVDAANPAGSLLGTLSFGATVPGRVLGSTTRTAERYARALDSLSDFPSRFLDSLKRELTALAEAIESAPVAGKAAKRARATMGKQIRIAAAQRLSLEAAYLYKADEANREKLRKSEGKRSFDELGNFTALDAPGALMSMADMEGSLASVRASLAAAIARSRQMGSLKAMARALLEYVNVVKLERERIIETVVDNPTPLHLICLKFGLPYNYAARLLSINRIPVPNFTTGRVNVYAR